ncbi:threonine dehydratase [Geodermatophilus bullaregiensis]|uniref:pyridoxal-phosphate dependent enzyme n=1 Tax=Geodermatophilus bullaregiensis TaxID=1564160 RepID=UPI00195ABEFB|nr:pyridoxal-phosphate dependent enzyme [Geodermatophilus bullaregiensis]MBM7809113.1 threonine dehydratase [Geodermatophilus bullaregiensis]
MTGGTSTSATALVGIDDVRRAAGRLAGRVHRTPVLRSTTLGELWGVRLDLKAEVFQRTGSFKARGALNAVLSLPAAERARGVITVSAGNAGAAVAFAAASVGVPGTVVMPATAVAAKVAACRAYGADVVLADGDLLDTYLATVAQTGRVPVHPFDDPAVVAGTGTVGLEIAEDVPDAEVVLVPVGGGGLISGVAAALADLAPGVRVIGIEPETADVVSRSLDAGSPVRLPGARSVADGLAAPMSSQLTLDHVRTFVERVVRVSDEDVLRALALAVPRTKLLLEPSAAAPLAALMTGVLDLPPGTRVVSVASGGNVDLALFGRLAPTPREVP